MTLAPSGFYNTSWIATVTGSDVDEHRSVLDRQLDPGSYRIVDVRAASIQRPPFWQYLSDAGVDSTVASIYSAPVLPSFRGTQVQGWGAIDPYTAKFGDRIFVPPETERLLAEAVPSRQNFYRTAVPHTPAEYRSLLERLLRSVEEQTSGLAELIERTRWDFFFGSYGEPHFGGHLFWHLSDPTHPSYDSRVADEVGETMIARSIEGSASSSSACRPKRGTSSSRRTACVPATSTTPARKSSRRPAGSHFVRVARAAAPAAASSVAPGASAAGSCPRSCGSLSAAVSPPTASSRRCRCPTSTGREPACSRSRAT